MRHLLLAAIVIALYLLHQDVWLWRAARPFIFGFLPMGLFYHVCFTLAVSLVMWLLVKYAWPAHLESEGVREQENGRGSGYLPLAQEEERLP